MVKQSEQAWVGYVCCKYIALNLYVSAIPLAAGVLISYGILLSPAAGAVLMSLSTVIVSINAKSLKMG